MQVTAKQFPGVLTGMLTGVLISMLTGVLTGVLTDALTGMQSWALVDESKRGKTPLLLWIEPEATFSISAISLSLSSCY
jgi:LDH2 family malate/lactate/ureidoglycolate dehydrogenase